jgi:predicted dehydrogenase
VTLQKIKWGVIGPGKIAQQFAQAIKANIDSCLYAVASRSLARAETFATQYDIPRYYTSYDALYEDDMIDAVYIATPHAFHFEQAKNCLLAGKHVLVEKPATINAEQWYLLTQIARQNKRTLIEAVWSRFMPCFNQVRRWISEGKVGDLTYVRSDIGFSFLDVRELGYNHRLFDLEQGGGALLDLGIYSVALSQLAINSQPVSVQAMADIGPSGVDHTTLVNVRYENGMHSQFTCSAVSEPMNDMTINGTKGYIELPGLFWFGGEATLVQSKVKEREGKVETKKFPHAINGFEYQIAEMNRCINEKMVESKLMPHQDTLENMQLMDRVRKNIELTYPDSVEKVD